MRRALVLFALGCDQGDPASCRVDSFARAELANQSPTDCGSFSLDSDGGFSDGSMQAAHDCVLDAVARSHAFTLFYDVWDAYRHLRGGFTGSLEGGKLHTKAYAYVGDRLGGSFDPRPVLTEQSCHTIEASGCTPSAGRPCLHCADPGQPATLCRY